MIRCCVFDFDGVIVDSNQAKRDAWEALFEDDQAERKQILAEVLATGYPDRYEVLRAVSARLFGSDRWSEAWVYCMAARYTRLAEEAIVAIGVQSAVKEFLAALSKRWPLYINSATPEVHLVSLAKLLEVDRFFQGIYGNPATKSNNLAQILAAARCSPEELLFVGDGELDLAAALATGCTFVGVANRWNAWRIESSAFPLVESVLELEPFLAGE